MTKEGILLDRSPRYQHFVGGPVDGRNMLLRLPDSMPWPGFQCHRQGREPWQHYIHTGDGTYTYAGKCAEVTHDGPSPEDWRCCCSKRDCEGNQRR